MTRRDRRKHEEAGWLSRLENNRRKEENRESGGIEETNECLILCATTRRDPLKRRERPHPWRKGRRGQRRDELVNYV